MISDEDAHDLRHGSDEIEQKRENEIRESLSPIFEEIKAQCRRPAKEEREDHNEKRSQKRVPDRLLDLKERRAVEKQDIPEPEEGHPPDPDQEPTDILPSGGTDDGDPSGNAARSHLAPIRRDS
jgi:hypothetical protein